MFDNENVTDMKNFLINMFCSADYRGYWSEDYCKLPLKTAKVLQDLKATEKQKEQVANEFEVMIRLSTLAVDKLGIGEGELRIALQSLKRAASQF